MSTEDNWTFLQPFEMSMEHCAKCQTCSDACPIYEESGENELYRPIYRSEILRRIYFKYVKKAVALGPRRHRPQLGGRWPG